MRLEIPRKCAHSVIKISLPASLYCYQIARSINFDVKKRRQDHDKGTRNSSIYRIEVPETHDEMDAEAPSVNVERSM